MIRRTRTTTRSDPSRALGSLGMLPKGERIRCSRGDCGSLGRSSATPSPTWVWVGTGRHSPEGFVLR
jgi:hypothetical protein